MRALLVLAVVAGSAAAACSAAPEVNPMPTILVMPNAQAMPACVRGVVVAVNEIFARYTAGDGDAVAAHLGRQTQWFTFTRAAERGGHRDIGTPALMRAYVHARHDAGERLTLRLVKLNGPGGGAGNDAMNLEYGFDWSANDGSGEGYGKAAIDCTSFGIIVWSMGEQ